MRRTTLARHVCQPRQRRPIAPVQIFEDKYERAFHDERLQRIGQFPQHLRRGDAFSVRTGAALSAGSSTEGKCASQLGAYSRRPDTKRSPSASRHRRPSASSKGR